MPVWVDAQLRRLSQAAFADVSYYVMAEIFTLHNDLGHLFDERVYKHALKNRIENLQTEVEIRVSFKDFQKSYFMDILVAPGAVFELKAVDALHHRHRSQLLNYLLLTELQHGKLVNLRAQQVEHEFVNATQTLADRIRFETHDATWQPTTGFDSAEKSLVLEMLREWGTGLERSLYEEALIHFFGGTDNVFRDVDVIIDGNLVSNQSTLLCGIHTAFKVTTFEKNADHYRKNLNQLLECTTLRTIQWINISHHHITFETIT